MLELTGKNVQKTMEDMFYPEGKADQEAGVKVEGIVNNYMFDPAKVDAHKQDIIDMVSQLPIQFMSTRIEGGGGGYTFLNACYRSDEEQWTGFQKIVESLICMGIAAGVAAYLMPKEIWYKLPGSVPYIIIDPNGIQEGDVMPADFFKGARKESGSDVE